MSSYRFSCVKCSYFTDKKSNYENHLRSKYHNDIPCKKRVSIHTSVVYSCSDCDYVTKRKFNFDRHLKYCSEIHALNEKLSKKQETKTNDQTKTNVQIKPIKSNVTKISKKTTKIKKIDQSNTIITIKRVLTNDFENEAWHYFQMFINIKKNKYPDPNILNNECDIRPFINNINDINIRSYNEANLYKFAKYFYHILPYLRFESINPPKSLFQYVDELTFAKRTICKFLITLLKEQLKCISETYKGLSWNKYNVNYIIERI